MNSNSGISSEDTAVVSKIKRGEALIVVKVNIKAIMTSKKKYFDIIKKLCYNIYTR